LSHRSLFSVTPVLALALFARPAPTADIDPLWASLCGFGYGHHIAFTRPLASILPTATCSPIPSGFTELPSVGTGGDTSVSLQIGYDADTQRLCYVSTSLPEAPVLRVGAGHSLSFTLTNTLHDTGTEDTVNCPIDSFEGEGDYCAPKTQFVEKPGRDGGYFPLEANQAETADGSSNLHVHGMFVPPRACQDEVLRTTVAAANYGPPTPLQPCQTTGDSITYTYQLAKDHPAGLYWYHSHRHGTTEQETQMGLAGAIVVEDAGDAWRASIGVTDEVLLVTDTPVKGCLNGVSCDVAVHPRKQRGAGAGPAGVAAPAVVAADSGTPVLDPRIDQVNQAGCADGATDANGGTELWTLKLNGAAVPESGSSFPPDSELLAKTMQPGQRQMFRLVNGAADSFLEPQLVLSQNGVQTVLPLEVFARDGVGLADSAGKRHFGMFDVANSPLVVPPAGRLEFVVHAPPAGATLYLQTAQFAPGCGGNLYPARRLLLISASGTPVDPGPADDHDLLEHTPGMAHYLATLNAPPSVHRTFVFSEYPRGFTYDTTRWLSGPPTTADYDPSQTDFFITETAADDGSVDPRKIALRPFLMNGPPQVVVHLHGQDSVTEQWTVENSTLEAHAFHMHQIHFRDVTSGSSDPDQEPILDTDTVPPAALVGDVATGYPGAPGWLVLNMTFTKQDIGEFAFHCHIMEHEDNGMMGRIKVVAD
jgi:FtsP/CotA-like multicopper oxidase with cupredoxin domain